MYVSEADAYMFFVEHVARLAAVYGTPMDGALSGPISFAIVANVFGDFPRAVELGRAIESHLEKLPDGFRGRGRGLWLMFAAHFYSPWAVTLSQYDLAIGECRRARDGTYEAHALRQTVTPPALVGTESLSKCKRRIQEFLEQEQSTHNPDALHPLQLERSWVAVCQAMEAELHPPEATWSNTTRATAFFYEMFLAAFGLGAVGNIHSGFGLRDLLHLQEGLAGTYVEPWAHFSMCIANCAALRGKLPLHRRIDLQLTNAQLLRMMRKRAEFNPVDFAHKITFIKAELLRNKGKLEASLPLYRQAAVQAKASPWRNDHALILEKQAEVLMELGRRNEARSLVESSLARYREWEGFAKVKQLETRYAELIGTRDA